MGVPTLMLVALGGAAGSVLRYLVSVLALEWLGAAFPWGTGTAAVVSPVGTLGYKGEDVTINGGQTGEVTQRLYDAIVGIQYGRTNDPHGWTSVVKVPAMA